VGSAVQMDSDIAGAEGDVGSRFDEVPEDVA
jgi:hypothetical protein